jgi:hypothetical protein
MQGAWITGLAATLAAVATNSACADELASQTPRRIIVASAAEEHVDAALETIVKERRGLGAFLRKNWRTSRCARPFVCNDVRYEPRISDYRHLNRTRQLPGYDNFILESIPTLPFHRDGYFQIPVR